MLYPIFLLVVIAAHWTLLRLPYFWDEGGYYIPAALDFFHTGTLIPRFTNAHPPLPNILLGTLWHLFGYHIQATRIFVCAFAAAALLAVYRLARELAGTSAAVVTVLLTGIYPIWFTQSSLAHADIFAATFTLWAFALYLIRSLDSNDASSARRRIYVALLFSLAVLSKETAIVQPAALAALEVVHLIRAWSSPALRRTHSAWLAALSFPLLPLVAWYAYHHYMTGFTFGNPEYLRYNATANLTIAHVLHAVLSRFLHLFWQRNIWVPLTLALGCLLCKPRPTDEAQPLSPVLLRTIALLVVANWVAFSVLGGALLTRYLLPIYPLLLLVYVATWRSRTRHWLLLAGLTAAAFLCALWVNPANAFAPEDNLTYRDMIVVHQEAIAYLNQHYPDATVLTAWPVEADLERPELGYTDRVFKVVPMADFSAAEIRLAAQHTGGFDTALVFTMHYASPALRHYLLAHPHSHRGLEFGQDRDLLPVEVAARLRGKIVWQDDRDGEWAAVIRFPLNSVAGQK